MAAGMIVGLLGAESTGKTTLAQQLQQATCRPGRRVAVVPEVLREFCAHHGRTPRQDEQAAIAAEQTRRIDTAARGHDLVFADTTALMIAVYSDWVFGDRSLYSSAIQAHSACGLTLLTALDIAWQADGLQRDGPQVRAPVDGLIRAALTGGRVSFAVIAGNGPARLEAAVASVERVLSPPLPPLPDAGPRWQWHCERCGDPDCERLRPST